MCYTENEQQEVSDEAERDEPMAEGTQKPSAKGTDAEAESEADRTLSVLWSDLQHTDACQVSLLCGEDAV